MLQSWSPGNLAVEFFENGNDAGSDQLALRLGMTFEDIERVNIIGVGGIKIAAVIDTVRRDVVENGVAKITVRIDNSYSPAFTDVIDSHVGDKSSFTGTRFTNDIGVAATVFALANTKDSIFVAKFGFGKKSYSLAAGFIDSISDG